MLARPGAERCAGLTHHAISAKLFARQHRGLGKRLQLGPGDHGMNPAAKPAIGQLTLMQSAIWKTYFHVRREEPGLASKEKSERRLSFAIGNCCMTQDVQWRSPRKHVLIIGGGASGALFACHLLGDRTRNVTARSCDGAGPVDNPFECERMGPAVP